MPDGVTELTTASFDSSVSQSAKRWLIDFYAEWCGPCHALDPVLDELAKEVPVSIGKLDVTDHREIADRYQVRSLPTLILFQDGEPVTRMFGVKTKRQLLVALDQVT